MKQLLTLLALSFFLFSCGEEGPQAVEIESLETHNNSIYQMSIKYPANWQLNDAPRRLVVNSYPEANSRFLRYDPDGLPAARIDVNIIAIDSVNTVSQIIENQKKFGDPSIYSTPKKVMIDGVEGTSFTYGFELNDGLFEGAVYVAAKDTATATVLTFEAFGGSFEKYQSSFDEIAQSLKLAITPEKAVGDTIVMTEAAEPPSSKLKATQGEGFTISIPENFSAEKGAGGAGVSYSRMYIGQKRGDSYIMISISDASKQKDLKKIAERTAKAVNVDKVTEVKLAGKQAFVLEYKPTQKLKRKMYYVINGDNLYQIILDWFAEEEADYLPVFEKCVNTFKFN